MSSDTRNSILVLDDDPSFRTLVANLLRPQGYKVVEANSPNEANTFFSKKETVLAIVDYKLPQMDGMTWITRLRESGGNTPIIFCSAVPCDAKTFSWLRNILGVALIIQKPIIPSTFLQQVESLLPGYQKSFDKEGIADVCSFESKSEEEFEEEKITEMRNLAKKIKIEQAVRQARAQYFIQLENDWQLLVTNIDARNQNPQDEAALMEAIRIAHSMRGTAGSLGLEDLGNLAGKIEDFLISLDPNESTDQEIYWLEINRSIAKGHELVKQALLEGRDSDVTIVKNRVLILSSQDDVIDAAREEETRKIAHVQGTDNTAAFVKYAAENKLDAVIIDTTNNIDNAVRDAAKIRHIPGNESIPIGIICTGEHSLSESEKVYIGASSVISGPVTGDKLRESVQALLKISVPGQPRILVVDDDEVLCKYAAGILADQRMETEIETSPIKALEKIAAFKPDLILLDVMMPVMTGYEVCRQLRSEKENADIPVVFLTSKTSKEAREAAFAVGASDFLTKPILTEELVSRVSAQLALASTKRLDRSRDPETKMLTGQAFMIEAAALLETYKKKDQPFSVALIEIDDFDMTTVVQGFHGSQTAALALGSILQERFPAESLRCKWSSSGYAIVVPGTTAQALAQAMEKALDDFSGQKFSGNVHKFSASFSAGVSSSSLDGENLEEIIKSAHHKLKAGRREKSGAVSVS